MIRIATLTRGLSSSVALTSAMLCAGGKMDEIYRQIYVPGDPTY